MEEKSDFSFERILSEQKQKNPVSTSSTYKIKISHEKYAYLIHLIYVYQAARSQHRMFRAYRTPRITLIQQRERARSTLQNTPCDSVEGGVGERERSTASPILAVH